MSSYGDNVNCETLVVADKLVNKGTTELDGAITLKGDVTCDGSFTAKANAIFNETLTAKKVEATEEVKGPKVEATVSVNLPVYADANVRNNAIPSPQNGMICITTNDLTFYSGNTSWKTVTHT